LKQIVFRGEYDDKSDTYTTLSVEARSLISMLFKVNPVERLSATEALQVYFLRSSKNDYSSYIFYGDDFF
jgi:hypothetical protein